MTAQRKTDGLTEKQRAFVAEYLLDLNATQAALRAHYAPGAARWASRDILTKPAVRAAVDAAMAKRAARTQDSQDDVIREIRETGEEARTAGKYDAALRALELRGRHLGMFKLQTELTGKNGGPIEHRNVSDLTDDELAAIARGEAG